MTESVHLMDSSENGINEYPFVFKKNPEDVSNFDEEFTREAPRFSSAKDKRAITDADHALFRDFDYTSIGV